MFDVRKEEVTIDGHVYKIGPLGGDDLATLFDVAGRIDSEKDESEVLEALGKQGLADLHLLVFKALKNEYPNEKDESLNGFTSQNLFNFLAPLIKVNTPKKEE